MKPDILLEAKLQHPRPVRDYVERAALIKKIKQCRERLIVFHANMGFGKTMFMSEYALQSGCRFLWYHLDRQDNDSSVFLGYLREGICQSFGKDGCNAAEEIRDGQAVPAVLKRLSSVEGGEERDFFIMLDDFQEIENEEIFELLDTILKNTGSGIRMFLTTKGTLPRFVNRYILEGTAAVLKTDDLAFSREETFRLLESGRAKSISPDVAEAIYRYTEGWPAGVMFLHLYQKQGRIPVGRDQMLKICQEYMVHDYIMYELFRKLPFDLQEFLKKTSVLEYLDSRICNAVVQIKNASGQLRYLVQENMFVQKTEGNFEVYRYHSMFRDFLRSQLTEEEQEKLCGRAAACYLGNGQLQQALEYALMANSRAMVEAALERSGFELLAERRYFLLAEALDWCRRHGGIVSEYGRVLESILKLYTDGDFAAAEQGILEEIRNLSGGQDQRLCERLVTMSVEFYCDRGMDQTADRILKTAMEQEGISAMSWFEYLAARIFLKTRQGFVHQAKLLYQDMSDRSSEGLSLTDRDRQRLRQLRRVSLELTELWTVAGGEEEEKAGEAKGTGKTEKAGEAKEARKTEKAGEAKETGKTKGAGKSEETGKTGEAKETGKTGEAEEIERTGEVEETGERKETGGTKETEEAGKTREEKEQWWMSDKEQRLLKQIRGRWYGGSETKGETVTVSGGEKQPEWLAAFYDVQAGLERFERGDKAGGCKLAAAGVRILKKYPWLGQLPGQLDRRKCSWLCMLEEAKETESASCHIFVSCFGKFRMTVMETGEDIRFRTHKAKECMAYLYFMKQPVSREQIIEALWNDVEELPANEVAALHNIFSTLRKSLSQYGLEDLICYEDRKYFLKNGCLFSDVDRAAAFIHAADAKDQEAMLQESGIIWLYEGAFLKDIDGVWCVSERAYFDRKLGAAFFELAQIYKKEQDYEACLHALTLSEEIDIIREPVNLCKMDCFIEQKDGNMLRRYYHQLEKYYLDLTGEPPGETLRERYQNGMKICSYGKQ